MDINALYGLVQPMYASTSTTRTLNLDVARFGVASLSALFTSAIGGTTLTLVALKDPLAPPTTETTQFLFDGSTDVLGLHDARVLLVLKVSGGRLVTTLTVFLSHAWRFADSFPLLANTIYDDIRLAGAASDGVLILSSEPDTYQGTAIAAGLNFYGTLDVALGIFDAINWFFNDHMPAPSHGTLEYTTHQSELGEVETLLNVDIRVTSLALPSLFTSDTLPIELRLAAGLSDGEVYERGLAIESTLTIASHPAQLRALIARVPIGVLVLQAQTNFGLPSPADLARFFGVGSEVASSLPDRFQGGNLVTVASVFFGIGSQSQKLEYAGIVLKALDGQSWELIRSNVLVIGDLHFTFTIFSPMDSAQRRWFAQFSGRATLFAIPIVVTARLPGLFVHGQLDELQEPPTIRDVVESAFGHTKGVPDDLAIARLSFSAQPSTSAYAFEIAIEGEWNVGEIGGTEVSITELALAFAYNGENPPETRKSGFIRGGILIGDALFTAAFDLSNGDERFTATWQSRGEALGLKDIVQHLKLDAPDIPPQFDLGLDSATLTYDITQKVLVLTAHSINYGSAIFIAAQQPDGWLYALGIDVQPRTLSLSQLPLIGGDLPPEASIALKSVQLLVASRGLDAQHVSALNLALAAIPYTLPSDTIVKGLNVVAALEFGTTLHTMVVPTAPGADAAALAPAPTATAATSSDNISWLKIQRAFGPIYFERIGFQYKHPEGKAPLVAFLLDAALTVGGLTLGLDGLAVELSIDNIAAVPSFHLNGLAIQYSSSAVAIEGAFLASTLTYKGKVYPAYSGKALLRTATFTLGAIGSYVQLDEGPSLFVYAVLDYPLGGPAFFFVTGLAAGFGYNRRLIAPAIEQVESFPLVSEAAGTTQPAALADELQRLESFLPPSVGDYFLAVGVRFSSFKMIDSFVLLTVAFGQRFELNILGISTMILPAAGSDTKNLTPIAEIQLALRATFAPDDGFFGIQAQLTPNSFLLSRACHLTGGFAFFSWFDKANAGDFVLSVGGYHPSFTRPPHYPVVPRLGFNWRVNENLTLKGAAYYALTPSMLMAGASLNATWEDGSLKAWFDAAMDFLIAWKPYHYEASFHINVGASYTFHFFGTHTINAHVGADVSLWGPEFSGVAHIDLSIVSFTIRFGADTQPALKAIDWPQFRASFLPDDAKICTVAVRSGLARAAQSADQPGADKENLGVVNPTELVLTTDSVIPSKGARRGPAVPEGQPANDAPLATGDAALAFGIGPLGLGKGEGLFSAQQRIEITYGEKNDRAEDSFSFRPLTKSAPFALWGDQLRPSVNQPQLVEKLLAGYEIRPLPPREPSAPQPWIARSALQSATPVASEADAFNWTEPAAFVGASPDDPVARERAIRAGIGAATKRAAIAALLPGVALDMGDFDDYDFLEVPQVAAQPA